MKNIIAVGLCLAVASLLFTPATQSQRVYRLHVRPRRVLPGDFVEAPELGSLGMVTIGLVAFWAQREGGSGCV